MDVQPGELSDDRGPSRTQERTTGLSSLKPSTWERSYESVGKSHTILGFVAMQQHLTGVPLPSRDHGCGFTNDSPVSSKIQCVF